MNDVPICALARVPASTLSLRFTSYLDAETTLLDCTSPHTPQAATHHLPPRSSGLVQNHQTTSIPGDTLMVFAYIALAGLFVATLYSLSLTTKTYMQYRSLKWRRRRTTDF